MNIPIRPETPEDYSRIAEVNEEAFEGSGESRLIEALRKRDDYLEGLSLVAEIDGQVVGHILFTPIFILGVNQKVASLSLAPMSVCKEYQNKGIGSALVRAGLKLAKDMGHESVIVLGHKQYYPRFGFESAAKWGIRAPWEVSEEVFMAIELLPGALQTAAGLVHYPAEFDTVP